MYQGETESETKYLRYYRGNTYNYGSRDYFYCTSTVNQRNLAGKYVFKFKNCIQSHKEHKQSQHFFLVACYLRYQIKILSLKTVFRMVFRFLSVLVLIHFLH